MKKRWLPIVIVAGAAILALLPYLGLDTYYVSLLTQAFVFGIAAAGLDLLVGVTGLTSMAHSSFFGIGAFTVAILSTKYAWTNYTTLGIAALMAVAVSILFGMVALRAEGVSFFIITLALNQIIWGVAFQWVALTGGENGITGVFPPKIFGMIADKETYYLFCLAMLALALGVMWLIYRSPFGLILTGIREQPRRIRALGYNAWIYKYVGFVIAALFAGFAGGLYAYYNMYASPADLSLGFTTQLLIMVILGGAGTLFGPAIGAIILVFLSNSLSSAVDRWQTLLGVVYVVVIMYAPDGLIGLTKRRLIPLLAGLFRKGGDGGASKQSKSA